jgi:YD repeat-containing protein
VGLRDPADHPGTLNRVAVSSGEVRIGGLSPQSSGGQWTSLGRYAFTEDNRRTITLSAQANGPVVADAVRLVRDNSGEQDTEKKTFTHEYDPNGNLTALLDSSSGARVDRYAVAYDGLNRAVSVEERDGGTVRNTTRYRYDANGNILDWRHDDQTATFTYDDPRDLVTKVVNAAADGTGAKTTTFTYTARGHVRQQTKPNGNTVDFSYYADGLLRTQVEKKAVTLDQQGDAIFQRAPLLASTGAEAGPLLAGQLSLSLSTVRVFTVAGGVLTPGATGDVVGASLADISLAPDSTTLYTASGSRDHAEAFAPSDLSRRGAYATGFRPNAVAASPDNRFLAIGRNTGGADDVFVYENGGSLPVNAFDLDSGDLVAPRGVAWSGDQKRLFVIAQTATNAAPQLEIITRPSS